MNILLIAATSAEIAPLTEYLPKNWTTSQEGTFVKADIRLSLLITGVGMVSTAYHLTKALSNHTYDLVLLLGIGGSFDRNIPLGDVVFVTTERYGDMGSEDHYNFLDVFELGLEQLHQPPFSGGILPNALQNLPVPIGLPEVAGISINTVAGTSFTADARENKYGPQVESMEGAAFHYVCLLESLPFAQVRAISNYVEARDKSKWQIPDAVQSLNQWAISFLEGLPSS